MYVDDINYTIPKNNDFLTLRGNNCVQILSFDKPIFAPENKSFKI